MPTEVLGLQIILIIVVDILIFIHFLITIERSLYLTNDIFIIIVVTMHGVIMIIVTSTW